MCLTEKSLFQLQPGLRNITLHPPKPTPPPHPPPQSPSLRPDRVEPDFICPPPGQWIPVTCILLFQYAILQNNSSGCFVLIFRIQTGSCAFVPMIFQFYFSPDFPPPQIPVPPAQEFIQPGIAPNVISSAPLAGPCDFGRLMRLTNGSIADSYKINRLSCIW